MRVIAGSLKGRRIHPPAHDRTRPTSDRVREALFSSIVSRTGTNLGGGRVLDAFAGSGALGIEALSRGARSATFIEHDRAAVAALRRSVLELELASRVQIVHADVFKALRSGRLDGEPYALLFLDPPYRINKAEVTALIGDLASRGALAPDALIVWEFGVGVPAEWPSGCVVDSSKRYGDTIVEIARWSEEEGEA